MSNVKDHDGLVDVSFLSNRRRHAETHCHVIGHHLQRRTIVRASHWVGLTLPGMIEEPGSFAGISNSADPARGRRTLRRMSLANLVESDTASVRSVPEN